MHELIEVLTVSVETIHANVIHVLGDIGRRSASSSPEVDSHKDHYITKDGEHYQLRDGLYYRVQPEAEDTNV